MIADKDARIRALDTSASFIVQAPAGSGKTELLIQRYLKLLEIVDAPDSVVAITFTRKAAGEMRSRVLEALRNARAGIEPSAEHLRITYEIARRVLEHDARLGWQLLRNPAQMRIETIDSLCAAITRRMPWISRFGGMPEFIEKADELYHQAARNTLAHVARGNQALEHLLLHLDNDFQQARKLIVTMLEKRDQWLRLSGAGRNEAEVRDALEASLQRTIISELNQLRAAFPSDIIQEITRLLSLDRIPEARTEDRPAWAQIADLLLTKEGEWRARVPGFDSKHPLKSRADQLLARLRTEDGLSDSLGRIRLLPPERYSDSQWQALQAAISVLTLAVAELQLVFREHGSVDFAELALRASEALGRVDSPTDLALSLGHRIQHLLVDEFQDTSVTQFELLEKLTAGWEPGDGHTLFLVGDPMQSIYRFREADVSLFFEAREQGIGSIRLEPVNLNVNFRSSPELIGWVNSTFQQLLPSADDFESGAVAFAESVARGDAQAAGEQFISFHPFLDPAGEAQRVIDLIKTSGDSKVAVLVRARSHLAAAVHALKHHRIPFQAIEIDQLGERPVIEDLMALTLALLHFGDRVSWLAILRAPWCGLTLADLHALATADTNAAIWDLLHRNDIVISADGVARVERIMPVLEKAVAQRGRLPLREWIENAWRRLGGPACVEDETALADAEAYFDLLEGLAEGADLADFARFRDRVNDLFAQPDAHATDRLQLMTIFKAKGLEFDTVILPGLGQTTKSDETQLLLWLEQRGELLLAPKSESGKDSDPLYKFLSSIEQRKADSELARVLYVAATRARRKLHLLSTVKLRDDGSVGKPAARSFLKLLWPMVATEFSKVALPESRPVEAVARPIHRVPVDWIAPPPLTPVAWTRADIDIAAADPISFEWAGDRLRLAGSALHAFLQRVAAQGVESWNESAIRANRAAYRTMLANLGMPPTDLDETAQLVETGLIRTLRDAKGRWILEQHAEAESEFAIAGIIDGQLHEAVIDRTFVDENGVRWIIDFKTGEHKGGDLETFLENERSRYQDQLDRYARLMMQREQRPTRLALYFPLIGAWLEWSASAAAAPQQGLLFEL